MRRSLFLILNTMLLLVVLSSANSIWTGVVHRARYVSVFPGATGVLFYVTLATSFAAGANCVMIWRRKRWALWLNIFIGLWSIALIGIVHGPRLNQLIVLVASSTTTALPWMLWGARRLGTPEAVGPS